MTSIPRQPAPRRLTAVLLALLVGGCGASTPPTAEPSPSTATSSVPSSPSASPTRPSPAATKPAPTAPVSCAAQTLASLNEPQRIGQIFMLGLTKDRLDASLRAAIAQFHFGSVSFTARTAVG